MRILDAMDESRTSSMNAVESADLDPVVVTSFSEARRVRGRFESPSAEDIGIRNFVLHPQYCGIYLGMTLDFYQWMIFRVFQHWTISHTLENKKEEPFRTPLYYSQYNLSDSYSSKLTTSFSEVGWV